jgi:hypothetical protein
MTFDPLGAFKANGQLNGEIVKAAKAFVLQLPEVPAGALTRIYAHWTVGHYGQGFPDYNVGITNDPIGHFGFVILGDPRDNAIGVNANPVHSHTYMRNTGALGIACEAMLGGNEQNFGPQPLTMMMLEWLCAGIAALAQKYDIDIAGMSTQPPYAGEHNELTHAEAANEIGDPPQYTPYGPPPPDGSERWDLGSFHALAPGLVVTQAMATACGDAIRTKAHAYKLALRS